VVLMLLIIIGNISLIGVIASTSSLHSITNMFIISLSVSDLLVGLVVIPVNLAVPTALFNGYTTCMYAACVTVLVAIASMSNIFAVTVDRYVAITAPLHYRVRMRPTVAIAMISVAWVYATILGLLPILGWRVTQSTCFRGETYPPHYTLLIFFSGCIIPVWGSGILYMRIFTLVRSHQRRITRLMHATRRSSPPTTQVYNWTSSSRKTIKTLAILMVYFEVSWLPVFVTMILDAFISPRLLPAWLHSLFGTLAFVNSALDPLIYGYRNRDIR
ncbi:hypothetical protein CAPTEDRAFT_75048, partial [Capitella teleta]